MCALALAAACKGKGGGEVEADQMPAMEAAARVTPTSPVWAIEVPAPLDSVSVGTFTPVTWMSGVQRVAMIARGDGVAIAAAGLGWLKLYDADGVELDHVDGGGVAQVVSAIDVDGDGRRELVVARGRGPDAMSAGVTIKVFRAEDLRAGAELIAMPPTSRAQVIDVVADPARPNRVWIGMFDSKFFVSYFEALRDGDGSWSVSSFGKGRVAADLVAGDVDGDATTDVIAVQMYGETKDEPGGVWVVSGVQPHERIPSTRGARAVAIVDGTVVFTDGWDRSYGKQAQALISAATRSSRGWTTTTLANVKGRYGYDRLCICDVDGDGDPDAVAAGHGPAVLVRDLRPARGAITTLGTADATDVFCGDLDGDGQDEVVIAGPTPGIWRMK